MNSSFRRYTHYALALVMFLIALSPVNGIGGNLEQGAGIMVAKLTPDTPVVQEENGIFDKNHPAIQAVMAVQNRHTRNLMAIPEVVGTASGLTESGKPAILVFSKKETAPGVIPESLEGVPVVVKVTGEITALQAPLASRKFDTTAVLPSPVPIGVSTGNIGECSAGTIGARVKKTDGTFYALSNNHVYALENGAAIGSQVVQPGRYDTSCSIDYANQIGTLAAFVPINFSGGTNTVDAAIAKVNYDAGLRAVGNATPSNGYGTPSSTTVSASIGQSVQKYGRTTSLTKGTVSGINATVTVSYGTNKNATFDHQIIISAGKPFSKAGDSGSLIVTNDSNANPVGLLFAGGGGITVANEIDRVLNSLNVAIDGK